MDFQVLNYQVPQIWLLPKHNTCTAGDGRTPSPQQKRKNHGFWIRAHGNWRYGHFGCFFFFAKLSISISSVNVPFKSSCLPIKVRILKIWIIFLVGSPCMDHTGHIFVVEPPYMDPQSVHLRVLYEQGQKLFLFSVSIVY